jgi:hypothetical protein
MSSGNEPSPAADACPSAVPPVALTRTARGWAVVSPGGVQDAADLVEGLSLADLVAEEFGALIEPDRTARRSARGAAGNPGDDDPVDARVAALERTVAQLEHALAARVSTERAIGVLAERHGTSARVAFESLRREARSTGRPVAELAREVLGGLAGDEEPDRASGSSPGQPVSAPGRRPESVVASIPSPSPRVRPHGPGAVAAADGRS